MTQPWGLVIAGGQGSRLGGVSKGTLRLGRVRLLDRAAAVLRPCARPLLIGTGKEAVRFPLPPESIAIGDPADGPQGPLAALVAAQHWLEERVVTAGMLATVAVDTPMLPNNYLPRMIDSLGDADAVQCAWKTAFYPTHALWRIEALHRALAGKKAESLRHLLERSQTRHLDWSDWHTEDPFVGLNTLDDVVRLGRRHAEASYSQRGE